jgi:hypothetical protein
MSGCVLVLVPAMLTADPGATTVHSISDDVHVFFLAGAEARDAIVEDARDPFFRRLTRIDAELRLREPLGETPAEQRIAMVKKLCRDAVRDWTEDEMRSMIAVCREVHRGAAATSPGWIPARWRFVKTDGTEESGAAYTRDDVIILPQSKLSTSDEPNARYGLAFLVAHETFHVISRAEPALRDRLYGLLGFRRIGPVAAPRQLAERLITNPDGPALEHALRIRTGDGVERDVAPVIYSASERYAPEKGRSLFQYLRVGVFAIETNDAGTKMIAGGEPSPQGIAAGDAEVFWRRLRRNTTYVIHPEEVVADNVAILWTRHAAGAATRVVNDEALLNDVARVLRETRPGARLRP